MSVGMIVVLVVVALLVFVVLKSIHLIGAAEVGLVNKRFAFRKLDEDNPVAFRGEAGYQATLLMPGLRFKLWPVFVRQEVPVGAGARRRDRRRHRPGRRPAADRREERACTSPSSATSRDLGSFVADGGQKGVQRPVLPPGTLVPIHPVAFLVLTPQAVYGLPVSPDLARQGRATAC